MDIIHNPHIKTITDILKHVDERIEGNLICDITPDNWVIDRNIDKIRNLQYLSRGKRKIMEIGVNACHSLILMLMENPSAEYLLFDLKCHMYTEPTLNYIKEAFPMAKITIIYGNSVETIVKYIYDNPSEINTYDLIHIDGGHTENIFSYDYIHSKILLGKEGLVIFDDYEYPPIKAFVDRKISEGEITEYIDSNVTRTPLHFVYKHT